MKISEKAKLVAAIAHHAVGQVRKGSNLPYIVHPKNVVKVANHIAKIDNVSDIDRVKAVAWLHDVIEDTKVPVELIEKEFGAEIAADVIALSAIEGVDRDEKKKIAMAKLNAASDIAVIVKIADIISNFEDIVESLKEKDVSKRFFKNPVRFMKEKLKFMNSVDRIKNHPEGKKMIARIEAELLKI